MKKQGDTFNVGPKKLTQTLQKYQCYSNYFKAQAALRLEICRNKMQCDPLLGLMKAFMGDNVKNLKIDFQTIKQ